MTPGKDQIVLQASVGLKEALATWAQEHNEAMAEVIRQAVAALIGYDLASDPKTVRATKYDSPEQQKQAALDRAALLRWGKSATTKAIGAGNIDVATIIARAVNSKDYETLDALKTASDDSQTAD